MYIYTYIHFSSLHEFLLVHVYFSYSWLYNLFDSYIEKNLKNQLKKNVCL